MSVYKCSVIIITAPLFFGGLFAMKLSLFIATGKWSKINIK